MSHKNPKCDRICVMNVPLQVDDSELQAYLHRHTSAIKSFHRIRDRGLVFVGYGSIRDAEQSLQIIMDEKKWDMRADFATNRSRSNENVSIAPMLHAKSPQPSSVAWRLDPNLYESKGKDVTDNPASTVAKMTGSEVPGDSENHIEATYDKKTDCVYCFRSALFICERCGDHYCSAKCQKRDWNRHRIICFPIPRLIPKSESILSASSMESVFSMANLKQAPQNGKTESTGKDLVDKIWKDEAKPPVAADIKFKMANNGECVPTPANEQSIACGKAATELLAKKNDESPVNPAEKPGLAVGKSMNAPDYGKKFPQNETITVVPLATSTATPIAVVEEKAKVELKQNGQKNIGVASPLLNLKTMMAARAATKPVEQPKPKIPDPMPIAAKSKVVISYVDNDSVYVRPANVNAQVVADSLKYAKKANRLSALPSRSDLVLAPFDGGYYRAVVIKADTMEEIHVAFIDFGNKEKIKLDELKEMSHELAAPKRLVTKISMKPLPEKLEKQKVLKLMKKLCQEDTEVTIDFDEKSSLKEALCDIILPNGRTHYDELIAAMTSPKVAEAEQKPVKENTKVLHDDITFSNFEGKNVNLTVIDNTSLAEGLVSVIESVNSPLFVDNESKIKAYVDAMKDNEPYKPDAREICLFKDASGVWTRSECVEVIADDIFHMLSIDFGILEEAKSENIRKLPMELAFPCLSNLCIIDGCDDERIDKDKLLESLALYLSFIADEVTLDAALSLYIIKVSALMKSSTTN